MGVGSQGVDQSAVKDATSNIDVGSLEVGDGSGASSSSSLSSLAILGAVVTLGLGLYL